MPTMAMAMTTTTVLRTSATTSVMTSVMASTNTIITPTMDDDYNSDHFNYYNNSVYFNGHNNSEHFNGHHNNRDHINDNNNHPNKHPPILRQMAMAVFLLSPVIMTTRMPAWTQALIEGVTSVLGGSNMPTIPTKVMPLS